MVQTVQLVLEKNDKLVVNISVGHQPQSTQNVAQLVVEKLVEAEQRFHVRNHVHYGHQVSLGHQRANSARVNRRQLLRSSVLEQPADWLEQIVQNNTKLIEMHAF